VDTFSTFYHTQNTQKRKDGEVESPYNLTGKPTPHHRKEFRGTDRNTQTLIPKRYKVDASLNRKIENMRDKPYGRIALGPADIEYIKTNYGVSNLSKSEPKHLSNTNMVVEFDPNLNAFFLVKHPEDAQTQQTRANNQTL
jgi:hypothetical protein